LIELDLSQFHSFLKIEQRDKKQVLFDPVRKSYYIVQPEEIVRQSWIYFLKENKNIPFSNLSVERQIMVGTTKKRFDLVLYDRGEAKVLFEFKSFNKSINEDTCLQVASYNIELKVPYVVISNGILHFAHKIDFSTEEVLPLNNLDFLDRN